MCFIFRCATDIPPPRHWACPAVSSPWCHIEVDPYESWQLGLKRPETSCAIVVHNCYHPFIPSSRQSTNIRPSTIVVLSRRPEHDRSRPGSALRQVAEAASPRRALLLVHLPVQVRSRSPLSPWGEGSGLTFCQGSQTRSPGSPFALQAIDKTPDSMANRCHHHALSLRRSKFQCPGRSCES